MYVYPLREKGQRLSKAEVLNRGPVFGQLLYRERVARSGIYLATLEIDELGTYGLAPLDRALLRRVAPSSMTLYGQEVHTRGESIKSSTTYWPQVWWCQPASSHALGQLEAATSQQVPSWRSATGLTDQTFD